MVDLVPIVVLGGDREKWHDREPEVLLEPLRQAGGRQRFVERE